MLNSCARESKARTGGFLKVKVISDHGLFSFYEGEQGAANGRTGNIPKPVFMYAQGFGRLDAGSRASFTGSRPPPPRTSIPKISSLLSA